MSAAQEALPDHKKQQKGQGRKVVPFWVLGFTANHCGSVAQHFHWHARAHYTREGSGTSPFMYLAANALVCILH